MLQRINLTLLTIMFTMALVLLAPPTAKCQTAARTTVVAGGPRQLHPSEEKRPRLQPAEAVKPKDELARAENQYVIYRSGENVPVPLTPGATLRLSLDAGISTGRMKEGVIVTRLLTVRAPLQTPYKGIYADKDYLVETEFSGQHSGFKDRAILMIAPKQFQVEVGPGDYLIVGKLNDTYVALKPGKWRFDLQCSLRQVVTPDGETWTARDNSETNGMHGQRFGRERKEPGYDDMYNGLPYFPHGELAFGISQLKGLWKFLVHRPNIVLSTTTDLYFYVDRMTATYIGPPAPTGPATIVR